MIIPGVVAHASRFTPIVTTGAAINKTTPPAVNTFDATNYNQNSATLNGSTSRGTLSFLWGTTTNPTTALASSSLTGLSSGTTYYFRAVAINNDALATLTGTVTTTSSSTVTFEWGTSSGVYTNVATVGTYTNVTSQTVSASITGLTPGTTYYYRIRATNSIGFVYGAELSFTATSVTVNGSVLSFTTYQFRSATYSTVGTTTWTNPTPSNGAPIDTLYNIVLIGGGAAGATTGGSSGQGRLITSLSISGNQTVIVGAGGSLSNFEIGYDGGDSVLGTQTAIGGEVANFFIVGSISVSGDGYAPGTTAFREVFGYSTTISGGGGGGASGIGGNGTLTRVAEDTYDAVTGSGGPGRTLSWTGIDGVPRSYAYGGGGAGGWQQGSFGRFVTYGVGGGYGGNVNVAGTNARGGGGGDGANGGSGYIYFEYWGP